MPASNAAVIRNRLLASLPADALAQISPRLTRVDLRRRRILYHAGSEIGAVYFLEFGMISLVSNMAEGAQAEVGVIGREGMLGTSLVSGNTTSFVEAMVQMPGVALRLDMADFHQLQDTVAPFRAITLRYLEALQTQIMQTAACNSRHVLEQRLARWLLMAHERAERPALPLTQEFLAMMLGVSRPSISITAGALQRAGHIHYSGGRVTVLDLPGLESVACECHKMVKSRFTELLGPTIS